MTAPARPALAAPPRADAIDLVCPACLRRGHPLRLTFEGRYRLCRCGGCGTQYYRADRAPAADAPGRPVSEYWEDYKFGLYADPAVQAGYEERYDLALRLARRAVGPVRSVLDVGCGIGNFVAYAASRGIEAYGVDVDADAVAAARKRGLAVAADDGLPALLGPGTRLDAVTLWDVIEHVYRPDDLLADVVPRLAPGGALLLETPDGAFPVRAAVRALHAATGGRVDLTGSLYYWEHKIYFTLPGLTALLARHGCTVRAVRRETSPKAKMQQMFNLYAGRERATLHERLLARAWPLLEGATRGLGMGNKLIVVAQRI